MPNQKPSVHVADHHVTIQFDYAIAKGRLSADENEPNYAGYYMYMGGHGADAMFKHIDTRKYLVNI